MDGLDVESIVYPGRAGCLFLAQTGIDVIMWVEEKSVAANFYFNPHISPTK